jgi:gamma-glutamyltranspeptidase/glutathione hydrolase
MPCPGFRQCAVIALALLALAGCGSGEKLTLAGFGLEPNFFGGAAADEPHAVIVARDVLSAGGSAADAAVALYFTLAVTYPSRASLGAGGACLIYRPDEDEGDAVETLDFLPVAPPGEVPPDATAPSAVPSAIRGLYALPGASSRPTVRWSKKDNGSSNSTSVR